MTMASTSPRLLAWSLVACAVLGGAAARMPLSWTPTFETRIQLDGDAPYAVITLLTPLACVSLNGLLGASLDPEQVSSRVCLDLCTRVASTAPALVLFAIPEQRMEATHHAESLALASADLWIARLPACAANEEISELAEEQCQRIVSALDTLVSAHVAASASIANDVEAEPLPSARPMLLLIANTDAHASPQPAVVGARASSTETRPTTKSEAGISPSSAEEMQLSAEAAEVTAARIMSRLEALWQHTRWGQVASGDGADGGADGGAGFAADGVPLARLLSVSHALAPDWYACADELEGGRLHERAADSAGESARGKAQARPVRTGDLDRSADIETDIVGRLVQPSRANFLLSARQPLAATVKLRSLPLVLKSMMRQDRGSSSTLRASALPLRASVCRTVLRCETCCDETLCAATDAAAELREIQEATLLNPMSDFVERAQQIYDDALAAFDEQAAEHRGTCAFASARGQLQREVRALLLRLTRAQLRALRLDAFASFAADLIEAMHTTRRFGLAARRLRWKHRRKFTKAAGAAVPSVLSAYRNRLLSLQTRQLLREFGSEVEERRPEAEALPPMAGDDGPQPWWKQILGQLIGASINAAQFYLLQYLPAKRKDLANERAQPRAPLF